MVIQSTNDAYKKRSSKRRRTLGPDALKHVAGNVIDEMMHDRQRKGRKQYRYADLQGSDRIEMLRAVRDCAMAAMTNFEIASYFGVTHDTLYQWVMKDPEFAIAMRLPKELADERVEKALYHRAVGYSFRAEEIKITDDGRVHRVEVVKHIPPDVSAATAWLYSRKGTVWKNRQDINVDGTIALDIDDKGQDPRLLAMAVLDVLQEAIYKKLPVTIDGEPAVASDSASGYTDADISNMTPEEINALFEATQED